MEVLWKADAFMALGGMYILIFFCGEIQCIVRKPLCYCRCKFKILTNPSPALFTIDATIMAFQSLPVAPRSMIGGYFGSHILRIHKLAQFCVTKICTIPLHDVNDFVSQRRRMRHVFTVTRLAVGEELAKIKSHPYCGQKSKFS